MRATMIMRRNEEWRVPQIQPERKLRALGDDFRTPSNATHVLAAGAGL